MSSICIIPARGGSKRLPGKNLHPLGGKPLLSHTIDAAVDSGCFDEVVVSSDDKDILALAQTHGVGIDVRSPEMAADTIRAVEVVYEFLERKLPGNNWDTVAMCLPTCPFRIKEDVKAAMDIFHGNKDRCPRLVGVKHAGSPQLALRALENHVAEMREPEAYRKTTRSQDMDTYYVPNGSIYVSTVENYMEARTFFGNPLLYHVMPDERSFDIDYEYQMVIAESMMGYLKAKANG